MASQPSVQFIDAALFCTSPFALSYADPYQKWLIREHLLSLLQYFPSLNLSMDTFFHNDGTTVNILKATGDLQVSRSTPKVHLTIWLHQNYPHIAPIVFVSPTSTCPIHRDHPFVDPNSGATTSPYLLSWLYPRSNLLDLVQNLVNLFSHNHPFAYNSAFSSLSHPSKREALDRLSCMLHYDVAAIRAETEEEIEGLLALQFEMVKRVDIATSMMIGLEHEEKNLKRRAMDLTDEADVLMNWLGGEEIEEEEAFEVVDKESSVMLDSLAADMSLEDLIYALDKAVERGVVDFDVYISQVRKLAREQFVHRALVVKLEGSVM
ncbi:Protein ELC-like [Actinidia chinensis var. chinensis]|uniref:Protein ELC-like n=1 Tax=Actinidia chinensis var. chinensis TaxID=1590841 RepID=A0A2R6QDY1_ACTCC|nr:Protein ELC-like [Actinidia chinensis var. chinensis]